MKKTYLIAALSAIAFFVVAIGVYLYVSLHMRLILAVETTRALEESLRTRTRSLDDIKMTREYIVSYYPSGTKQTAGSDLDELVERCRRLVLEMLDDEIKHKTGKGDIHH